MGSAGIRLNLLDNLDELNAFRLPSILPVRSNIDDFTNTTVSLENLYMGWGSTLAPDIYAAFTGGYLEEMYAGLGGEVLWRPYDKRYAFGAELWQVFKRDPQTSMNIGLTGDRLLTGYLHGWYNFPGPDLTLQASMGRYLAEDLGGTLRLFKTFENGVKTSAFMTLSDQTDQDIFGGTTNLYSGINISLPLGSLPYVPDHTQAQFNFAQIGRDNGQALQNPRPLYDMTEKFSLGHIKTHWQDIVK